MRTIITIMLCMLSIAGAQAQFLKKIKQKAENAVKKTAEKMAEPGKAGETDKGKSPDKEKSIAEDQSPQTAHPATSLTVYSKFDFVPGSTILYFDNFEKDNIGEAPDDWITSQSAEVVTIDGLEGNWLKMASKSAKHFFRSKKQSWGNNFTIEFDLLMVKNTYAPRLDMMLVNTGEYLVTDENIIRSVKNGVYFETIIEPEHADRATLYQLDNDGSRTKLNDDMKANLPFENTKPVHISICVQGKRFRMWWNETKLYDLSAINENYLPNQFGLSFGGLGGSDFYISNIRLAKDVPDTRAKFKEGKFVSNILFYTGSSNLKPESMGALLDLSKVLKEAGEPIKIIGHTDSDGDEASNITLSQQRAITVKNTLVKQYGIKENMLTTEGRGETQPIANNNTSEGKAQNRRVEFIFKAEADTYSPLAGTAETTSKTKGAAAKPSKTSQPKASAANSATGVNLQSKILNIQLPYAQIQKTGEYTYTFFASKEEGNSKENYFKIDFATPNTRLKPETMLFYEQNKKNPLFGSKKLPEIKKTEAVLYYGAAHKTFIHRFSPVIDNNHTSKYISVGLGRNFPEPSPNCKLVIEKVEDGRASGYFVFGTITEGLKPVTVGDASRETFTTGFTGEMKCTFSNVPVQ